MATNLGYRIIAKIYENEAAYKSNPENPWGFRFFDETGKAKKSMIDISVKDLAKKKDTFNALSVRCYHAHLIKTGSDIKVVCEDGDFERLPCITKDGVCFAHACPMAYAICYDGDKISHYDIVVANGETKKLSSSQVKDFILNNMRGQSYLDRDGSIKMYNLRVGKRSGKPLMTRVTNYAFPTYKA